MTERGTEKEHEIIVLLMIDPSYNYEDFALRLKVSRKTISESIKSLKNKGIIEFIGSDAKEYWKINA